MRLKREVEILNKRVSDLENSVFCLSNGITTCKVCGQLPVYVQHFGDASLRCKCGNGISMLYNNHDYSFDNLVKNWNNHQENN